MSKSLGNVVDPAVVIEGGKNQKEEPPYGADVLRLWVSSVDYSTDVPLGKNLLKQMGDIRNKIRNTARFLLGNLHDFDPQQDAVPYQELPELDRYMLHRMTEVFGEVEAAFESFQFFRFFQTVQNFCVVDLSNFYLDVAKDRLYISAPDAYRRRSCQTVLAIALENLAKAIAPVLCHTAEDIWQYIPYSTPYKSVFEAGWVKVDESWKNPQLATKWQQLRQLRQEVNKVMEQARSEKTIGSSLEAKVLLYVPDEKLHEQLAELNPEIVEYIAEEPAEPNLIDVEPYTPPGAIVTTNKYPVLQELNVNFGDFVRNYNQPLITVGLILATMIAVYVIGGTLGVINRVPLLEPFFRIVGLLYSLWYARNYFLFAEDRKKWLQQISTYKAEILGKTAEIPEQKLLPAANEPEAIILEVETLPQDPGILKGVDELRYLFICSQVELLDSPDALADLQYKLQTEKLGIGIVKADGEKCDRCWNYSLNVGKSLCDPLLCERCIPALQGKF